MTPVFNPLKSLSTEEIRKLSKEDPNPIVRFACLQEEGERTICAVITGRTSGQIIKQFELSSPR